jgi:hypothetical protein
MIMHAFIFDFKTWKTVHEYQHAWTIVTGNRCACMNACLEVDYKHEMCSMYPIAGFEMHVFFF